MIESNEYYVVKLFSIKYNEFTYLYASNPHRDVYEATRFSSYEEGYARMQELFEWGELRKDFDMSKSKVCKITLIEEEI
jgi:hypothetical protein